MEYVRSRAAVMLLTVTLASYLIVQLFLGIFIYRDPSLIGSNIAHSVVIVLVSGAVTVSILFRLLTPLHETLGSIAAGQDVDEPTRRAARRRTVQLPILIIAANAIGFCFGPLVSILIGRRIQAAGLSGIEIAQILILNIAIGCMASNQEIALLDIILLKAKSALDLRSQIAEDKDWMLSRRLIVTAATCVMFASVLSGLAAFGFYRSALADLERAKDSMAAFIAELLALWVFIVLWSVILIQPLAYSLKRRIDLINHRIDDLIEGNDLSKRVDIVQFDEIGRLGEGINRLITALSAVMAQVRTASQAVAGSTSNLTEGALNAGAATAELRGSAERVHSATSSQAAATTSALSEIEKVAEAARVVNDQVATQAGFVEQSSAAISEMAANIASVTRLTERADELSQELRTAGETGRTAIKDTAGAMRSIEDASKSVTEIVRVIQKITAQTNLLAMNAAIEAAHAGDSGAGFAVVADEVRSLAESSAKSAKEIERLVKDMGGKIAGGVRLSDSAADAFNRIEAGVNDNGELVRTIAASMEEQKIAADEILNSINSLVDATGRIKELASDQHERAERTKASVAGIGDASSLIGTALSAEADATKALEAVVELIRAETERNRLAAAALERIVGRFG